MKSITFMLASIALLSLACTEKSLEIPQEVTTAFSQKYPSAESIKWEMEDGDYEAEFKVGDLEMSANFSKTGLWLESETALKSGNLPEAVVAGIAANFPGAKIEEAEKLDLPDSSISYEVKLEGDQDVEAVFSANGELINKTIEKEDGDHDNEDDDE